MSCSDKKESMNINVVKNEIKSTNNQISVLYLSDDVLLHVFSYLNLIDVINVGETCVRLRKLCEMTYKKFKMFDLVAYFNVKKEGKLPLEAIVSYIGPSINTFGTRLSFEYNVNKTVMEKCTNVKSLLIYPKSIPHSYPYSKRDILKKWNTWIKQLKLESLTLRDNVNVNELYDGVTTLKELKIQCRLTSNDACLLLGNNCNVTSLSIPLIDLNYDIFEKLEHLKRLHLIGNNMRYLTKLTQFLKMDGLKEFDIVCLIGKKRQISIINTFLNTLAKNSKLEKLTKTWMGCSIDTQTFEAIKKFNLSSLSLFCRCSGEDFMKLIMSPSNVKILNLGQDTVSVKQIIMLVKSWNQLEQLNVCYENNELAQLLDEGTIIQIFETSIDRPNLKLSVHSLRTETITQIEFYFRSGLYKVKKNIKEDRSSNHFLGLLYSLKSYEN